MFPGTDFFQLSSKTFPTDLPILHPHPLFTCYNKKKTEEEIDTMSSEQAKALAHELTMEYVRQHRDIMSNDANHIRNIVDDIAFINKNFYDEIIKNDTFNQLY